MFTLNDSPNHTGMEAVQGRGNQQAGLLYNGGSLWRGTGQLYCRFQELPQPRIGEKRQGWYHAIPADVVGDKGEELIIYNPWDKAIFIYTGQPKGRAQEKAFVAGPRQYNPRLMD